MPSQPFRQRIPSLVQGISTQAPSVRFPGQVEDAKNISFNVRDGARKRPGSKSVINDNTLGNSVEPTESFRMHKIERDDKEEYLVVFSKNADNFKIYDIKNQNVATINSTARLQDYLAPAQTVDDIRMVTIGDATFLLNANMVTDYDSTNTPGQDIGEQDMLDRETMPLQINRVTKGTPTVPAEFDIKYPDWTARSRNEQVIDDFLALGGPDNDTVYSPGISGAWSIEYMNQSTEDTVDREGRLRHGSDVPVQMNAVIGAERVRDYLQGNGLEPEDYDWGQLGLRAFPFGKVIVTGGPLPERKMNIIISTDIPMFDKNNQGDPVSDAKLAVIHHGGYPQWYDSRFGDKELSPPPAFAKNRIRIADIAYFRDRLVFGAEEFICFSQASDLLNFYSESMLTIGDADPIEIQLAAQDVCFVDYMIPFNNTVIIFTKAGQQFEISNPGVLAPDTAAVTPSTRYETQSVRPIVKGNELFMAGRSRGSSVIWQYVYTESSAGHQAVDLTSHVSGLIGDTVISMDSSSTQDCLYILPELTGDETEANRSSTGDDHSSTPAVFSSSSSWSGGEAPNRGDNITIKSHATGLSGAKERVSFTGYGSDPRNNSSTPSGITGSKLHVYRTYKRGQEIKQQAWSTWEFGGDAIMDVKVVDDEMYILRRYNTVNGTGSRLGLDKIDLTESRTIVDTEPRTMYLDHQLRLSATRSGSAGSYVYTCTLPSGYTDDEIDAGVFDTDGKEYAATYNQAGNTVTIATGSDNYTSSAWVYVGRKVDAEITLSEVFHRDENGSPIVQGRTAITKLQVSHTDSRDYSVEVSSSQTSAPTRSTSMTSDADTTGDQEVWVMGRSKDTTMKLKSNNTLPVIWSAVEIHGMYETKVS